MANVHFQGCSSWGDFVLPDMLIILVPENEHQEFGQIVQQVGVAANFVGLKWDVESIIARRAGFYADEAGPF